MEALIVLFLLACLLTFVGGILGLIAFARIGTLSLEVRRLQARVAELTRSSAGEGEGVAEQNDIPSTTDDASERQPAVPPTAPPETPAVQPLSSASAPSTQSPRIDDPGPADAASGGRGQGSASAAPRSAAARQRLEPSRFVQALQRNWMAWLGGFCIALAGIFLGKYSIEQGLLGPGLRIALGVVTGLVLHSLALWLRLKKGSHPSLAALAGGGSITLFATLLAALHFYQMFSPSLVFVLLALVALATMWLAIYQGPLLAIIGMLGAYAVPALVSTGSGNVLAALFYALIITVSVLLLARVVRMSWLWWGAVLGALGWWYLSLTSTQVDGLRGLYLTVLAYLLMAVCSGNWRLLQSPAGDDPALDGSGDAAGGPPRPNDTTAHRSRPAVGEVGLPAALFAIVIAQLVSLLQSGWAAHWPAFLALPALLLFASPRQPRLLAQIWVLLLGTQACVVSQFASFPQLVIGWSNAPLESYAELFYSLLSLGLLAFVTALYGYRLGQRRAWWASLLAMTPVLSCLCAFLSAPQAATQLNWTLLFAVLAALQMAIAVTATQKSRERWLGIWHFIAGHCGYALAVAVAFEAATLTLALAAQVLSLAWLIKRYEVSALGWLLKLVVLLVVVRLTVNPWLVDYPAIWHWPLWTYGGATLLCWLSSRQLADHAPLRRWTEIASLHLFVLTVWAEARYLLYDGRVFFVDYSFSEATLYIGLAGSLSLLYHQRARISAGLKRWYQGYSFLLLAFALLNYMAILLNLLNSESWAVQAVGATPVVNLLTPALGLPIVLSLLFARFYTGAKPLASLVAGVTSFIFVSFQIRHLWQGTVSLQTSTSAGELYTYSVVWLLMAVAAMLVGGMRQWQNLYRGGLVMLAVVILKIFLIDLSDLDGLFRVASFMGLGLALVGISFLHQRLKPAGKAATS